MGLFGKRKIVCDDDLKVLDGKSVAFAARRIEVEKCILMHDAGATKPGLIARIFRKGAAEKGSLVLLSGEGEIELASGDKGFDEALDWLRAGGWAIDDAIKAARQSPMVHTFVRKT